MSTMTWQSHLTNVLQYYNFLSNLSVKASPLIPFARLVGYVLVISPLVIFQSPAPIFAQRTASEAAPEKNQVVFGPTVENNLESSR